MDTELTAEEWIAAYLLAYGNKRLNSDPDPDRNGMECEMFRHAIAFCKRIPEPAWGQFCTLYVAHFNANLTRDRSTWW
jgi:hypothetical protein